MREQLRKWAVVCAMALLGMSWTISAGAMSVVFINPGKSDEAFWGSVSSFMQAAANDLSIDLEILYAERDSTRMLLQARQVAVRKKRPDYVITVNEKQVAVPMLKIMDAVGIKTFLINNTLSADQVVYAGQPRDRLRHWLGSLVPNNEEAGYQMAKSLIAAGHRRFPHEGQLSLIAIAGDRATEAGVAREAGLRRALAEHPEVKWLQTVYGEWNQKRARDQAEVLFKRYPNVRLVWCANDMMAFGAMESLVNQGGVPGQDKLFTGLNNSRQAMDALSSGRLAALSVGHFSAGGWAMVMLYDYDRGYDFADIGSLERQEPLLTLFSEGQAQRFLRRFGQSNFESIDFRQYSRAYHPQLKSYRFSMESFLK